MKMLQLLGDFTPDPLPALRPWTPLGDFRPQTPDKSLCTLPPTCVGWRHHWSCYLLNTVIVSTEWTTGIVGMVWYNGILGFNVPLDTV